MATTHAVVDGSNLATEGRSEPSLAQLDEAVATFAAENRFEHITVVVDASFEHRVAKKEQRAAKKAIDEGRIVTPPAGVVGRGDTFILEVADKAGAVVVSNDSFQEFHGRFDWLFEEGRLIGGKPIDHVGWVFVPRVPVRGKTSREAVRNAQSKAAAKKAVKKAAKKSVKKATPRKSTAKKSAPGSEPKGRKKVAPEPDAPAKKRAAGRKTTKKATTGKKAAARKEAAGRRSTRSSSDAHNPARAWRRFRSEHPVGSEVEATVERYSSHGAYALTADGLSAYLPSQLLADPPPKRARDVVSEGETRTFVVHELDDEHRGIDLGLVPVDR